MSKKVSVCFLFELTYFLFHLFGCSSLQSLTARTDILHHEVVRFQMLKPLLFIVQSPCWLKLWSVCLPLIRKRKQNGVSQRKLQFLAYNDSPHNLQEQLKRSNSNRRYRYGIWKLLKYASLIFCYSQYAMLSISASWHSFFILFWPVLINHLNWLVNYRVFDGILFMDLP